MLRRCLALVVFTVPLLAQQQTLSLTLDEALSRARDAAPAVVAAKMRIEETRTALLGASALLRSNPAFDLEAGKRSGDVRSTDLGFAVEQELDFPRARRARIDAARAAISQEESRAAQTEREAMREVATVFVRALEARERGDAAEAAKNLAEEALLIAERRYAAGDVAQLDVNVARSAVARAASAVQLARAAHSGLASTLRVLLALDAVPSIEGSLREPIAITPSRPVATDRADVRLLDAEIAQTEAEGVLAQALRWPQFGLRAAWNREEGNRIVTGGVGITLPLFQRGGQEAALASAQRARLRAERESLVRTIDAGVQSAIATVDALRGAAADFEANVLPLIQENERLALESYEAGQIGLADLLVVRSDALDARRDLLELAVEARLAEIELRTIAGVFR